jgi:pentatricopeptide repeat protein
VEQTEEQMSSEETAGHSSGEDVVKVIEVEETTNEVEEKRSSKDRAHLMQLQHQTTSGQIWSLINHAEQFFAKMPEKNGATYDALILGLVKFMNFDRAWEMFGQMSKEGHQASVATYNSLLYVIGNTTIPDPWSKAMSLVQQMSHEPVVKPNISTMNLLLEISSQTGKTSAMQLSLKTFREALHLGLEPTLTTFLALLRAHIKSSDGSVLYDITDYLEKNQHVLQITDNQDIYFFLVAMTTARNMLDHELATRLVRLCDRDNWMLCQNITLFISYFLITISGRVPIETLRKEYYQYVPKIILPMEWTYGVMFAACEHQDSPTFALELWNHVMKYRVGVSSLETLVRFCGAMSKRLFPSEVDAVLVALNQAWDKCQQMNASPPPLMISQIIRLHCMKKDLDQAWEYFSKFEEKPT